LKEGATDFLLLSFRVKALSEEIERKEGRRKKSL
jgi:hypothetical protein